MGSLHLKDISTSRYRDPAFPVFRVSWEGMKQTLCGSVWPHGKKGQSTTEYYNTAIRKPCVLVNGSVLSVAAGWEGGKKSGGKSSDENQRGLTSAKLLLFLETKALALQLSSDTLPQPPHWLWFRRLNILTEAQKKLRPLQLSPASLDRNGKRGKRGKLAEQFELNSAVNYSSAVLGR